MKKLLLIADSTYATKDEEGTWYFRGSFSVKTWERYLNIADTIFFICREDKKIYNKEEATEKFQKVPLDRIKVSFVTNPRSSLLTYINPFIVKKNTELIEKKIQDSDGVIIRTLSSASASRVISIIKKYKKKYMYECVGNGWDALWNYGIKGKILAPKAYFSEKKLASAANCVLYVTENYLQSWYPSSAPQIGISDVDVPVATDEVLTSRLKKIDSKASKLVLGTTGSVEVAYKGQEYVIRAIGKLVREKSYNIEYQLVGGGKNNRLKQIAVEEGVDDKIVFLGALSHEAVLNWLDKIDIYIQPSMLEGMPRALIEAMSRALPCFGSNVGGIPELLDAESMFKKKNIKEIIGCIENMSWDFMEKEAKRNFYFSKKFYNSEKDEIRRNFYENFENECVTRK